MRGAGTHPVIELSSYVFEVLRKDKEFILYRGRSEDHAPQAAFASRLRQATARPDSSEMQSAGCGHDEALAESGYGAPSDLGRDAVSVFGRDEASRSRVLVLSPATEHPPPQSLKRLEHEYSLREALDPRWAARPMAMTRHGDRTVLVLEDPGGCAP